MAAGYLNAVLDGFVVGGGSADFRPDQEPPCHQTVNTGIYGSGGGMFCINTNVTVSDCEFELRITLHFPEGASMPWILAEFSNCTFRQNRAPRNDGGGFYFSTQAQQFTNCVLWVTHQGRRA